MQKLYVYLFLVLFVVGCKKDPSTDKKLSDNEIESALNFRIEAKANEGIIDKDISCTVKGDEITAIIPEIESSKSLVLSFDSKLNVSVDGVPQVNGQTRNDFSKTLVYDVTFADKTKKSFKFKVLNFTGLPIFYLDTEAPIVSKDDYVKGSLTINPNLQFEQATGEIALKVKGRGNSTWDMDKKPYKLKFDEKAEVLGLSKSKTWVLLANYSDKTLMRTSLAFELGRKLGADFTPECRPVELVLNGVYNGSYLLTEQVEVDKNRVDIAELNEDDTDADVITGGYLLELDERLDETYWFRTKYNLPFTIKAPEDITTAQFNYIKNYIQATETAIASPNFADPVNGYAKYINVNSFINWFLVQELVKNQDARNYSSIYYYKDRDGKLGMGPLWDFDLSMGNVDYSDAVKPEGWWVKNGAWIKRLFDDPAFKQKVRKRWDEIKDHEIAEMLKSMDESASYLELSQQQNFKKWDILDKKVWPNPMVLYTYPAEVEQIKTWLTKRIAWIDKNL